MDGGAEAIADGDELARVVAQARRVRVRALLLALAVTAAALLLPG